MKLWLALLSIFFIASAAAEERIHEYLVDISIHKDGSMLVTETIDVNIEGVNIRHGIYRDFPVHYKDKRDLNTRLILKSSQPSWMALRWLTS